MFQIFKLKSSIGMVALFGLTILLHLHLFLQDGLLLVNEAPLSRLVYWGLSFIPTDLATVAVVIIYIALVFFQAVLINNIFNAYRWEELPSFLPGACYVLLVSLFSEQIFMTPPFLASFFILLVLERLFRANDVQGFVPAFDAGFCLGIASLFYFPAILLLPFLYLAFYIIQLFEWRILITSLAGILIPYFLVFGYFFLADQLVESTQHFNRIIINVPFRAYGWIEIGLKLSAILFTFLLGLYFVQQTFLQTVVKKRRYINISVSLAIMSLLTYALQANLVWSPLVLSLMPISLVGSYGLLRVSNKWIGESLLWSILLLALIFQWITLL